MKLKTIHGIAGTAIAPENLPPKNHVTVYLVHEGKFNSGVGCGALEHLNKQHAKKTVEELWSELKKLGLNPSKYFGMRKESLLKKVLELNLPDDAQKHAENLFETAEKNGLRAIIAVYSHEEGKTKLVGATNLSNLPKKFFVSARICSDARISEEVARRVAEAVLEKKLEPGQVLETLDLIAPNPEKQAPLTVIVHPPEKPPRKARGRVFNVSSTSFGGLLSLAYALVNFGPHGTKSLKQVLVVDEPMFKFLKQRLKALKKIKLRMLQKKTKKKQEKMKRKKKEKTKKKIRKNEKEKKAPQTVLKRKTLKIFS